MDTNIWIRALSRSRTDARSVACREFYDAMIAARSTMLLAAPSLAELVRGDPSFAVPSTTSIIVVPFDRVAAQILGTEFPHTELRRRAEEGKADGLSLTYLKYDAMIAACALRWGAKCLVAYDSDHTRLARHVPKLRVAAPEDFRARQTTFELSVVAADDD